MPHSRRSGRVDRARERVVEALAAVLLVLGLALDCAGGAEAQGLAELAAALEECPSPPPPRPVPPYDVRVTMSLGSGRAWVTGDHLDLSAQPGILNRVGGGSCWISQATVTSGLTGEVSEQGVLVPQSCEPVPEPGFGVGLAVGVVAMASFTARWIGSSSPSSTRSGLNRRPLTR